MQKFLLIFEDNIAAVDVIKYIPPRFSIRIEGSTFITAAYKYESLEVAELDNSEETLLEWFEEDSLYVSSAEHSFIELMYSEKSLAIELVKAIVENEKLIGVQFRVLFIKTSQLLRLDIEYINISFL